jgi:hypothetical protein
MSELHDRGVVRSGNNPIADIAERVIADYHGVDPEPPNNKSYDVVAKDGTTIPSQGSAPHEELAAQPLPSADA